MGGKSALILSGNGGRKRRANNLEKMREYERNYARKKALSKELQIKNPLVILKIYI